MTTSGTLEQNRSPLSTLGRVAVGVIVAASFGVWGYAYSGLADRPPPDLLADTDVAARAEAICAAALADVALVPPAQDAVDGPDRADQVTRTTDRFEAMVDDLERLPVDEGEDRVIMEGWLGDWRVVLRDRRAYAEAVAADPDAVYLQSQVAAGERLDRRVTRVANTNHMPSCATPTDAG